MDIETLQEIHQEILHLRDEIQNLKDNHLHHLDIIYFINFTVGNN